MIDSTISMTGVIASARPCPIRGGVAPAGIALRLRGTTVPTAALDGTAVAFVPSRDLVFSHLQASLPT